MRRPALPLDPDTVQAYHDETLPAEPAKTATSAPSVARSSAPCASEQMAEKCREEGSQVYLRADAVENSSQTQ